MFNKKLLLSVVGFGAIVVGSSASASTFNFFQDSGPYVGVQGGWGRIYHDSSNYELRDGGFGGRAYAGFELNPYLSVEGGYTRFPNSYYDALASNGVATVKLADVKVKPDAWDIVGKVSLPFSVFNPAWAGFSLYGKAGAAYVDATTTFTTYAHTISVAPYTFTIPYSSYKTTTHGWEPVYGVGAAYSFNNGFGVDVSYTRIESSRSNSSDVPSASLAALGVSYKFNLANFGGAAS